MDTNNTAMHSWVTLFMCFACEIYTILFRYVLRSLLKSDPKWGCQKLCCVLCCVAKLYLRWWWKVITFTLWDRWIWLISSISYIYSSERRSQLTSISMDSWFLAIIHAKHIFDVTLTPGLAVSMLHRVTDTLHSLLFHSDHQKIK